jgi:hypothetical protein
MPPSKWNSSLHSLDAQPAGQEGGLAQALTQRVARELALLEDVAVGQERDDRSRGRRDAGDLHLALRHAARELLPVDLAVALDRGHEPFRERVHHGDTDAVEPA